MVPFSGDRIFKMLGKNIIWEIGMTDDVSELSIMGLM